MVDVAVTAPTLVLRFADVGIATYASLRVVGEPSRTVTWVITDDVLAESLDRLAEALPDPRGSETRRDAVDRAITRGPFATPESERSIADTLGAQLLAMQAWQLLVECVSSPRAALFVSPSARLARVPWGLLAMPDEDGFRLMELVDVLMAAPSNIVHAPRTAARWGIGATARRCWFSTRGCRGNVPTPRWARCSVDRPKRPLWQGISLT